MTDLLVALGTAAKQHGRGILLSFDELQFVPTGPLGAFVAGLHKVAQRELPLTIVAAGLPQTRGVVAEAATYSERMFETRTVDALQRATLGRPWPNRLRRRGSESTRARSWRRSSSRTADGYPFFLQVFGDHL